MIKTSPDVSQIIQNGVIKSSTYILSQNYPNPFNPSTTIEFEIPLSGYTSLKVYNVTGQEITTLVDGELISGIHKVEWKPRNEKTYPNQIKSSSV